MAFYNAVVLVFFLLLWFENAVAEECTGKYRPTLAEAVQDCKEKDNALGGFACIKKPKKCLDTCGQGSNDFQAAPADLGCGFVRCINVNKPSYTCKKKIIGKRACTANNSGSDPHILTFDGLSYDVHEVGSLY